MLALLLAVAVQAPAEPPPPRPVPTGFADALGPGLAITVGVYGVGRSHPRGGLPGDAGGLPFADDGKARVLEGSLGAGFVIDASGGVVTAAHVVAGSDRIVVRLPDHRVVLAELLGVDVETDIALLRLPLALPAPPPVGRSAALRSGDWVLAVGEPFGFRRSVSAGIVGGTDRHVADDPELLFIQSDLTLSPGSSGGPLLDGHGAVVGMNSRVMLGGYGVGGVSLSVPIEVVLQIAAELRQRGAVQRPRLGAVFQDVPPPAALEAGRADTRGVLVGSVDPGSLAAQLGVEPGDIVVGMNGRAIGQSADLARALLSWRGAAGTRLTVWRGGRFRQLLLP